MTAPGITVAAVDKKELAAALDQARARRIRPEMTWRDLLMQVTEELRHAPPEALDAPVMVQLVGRVDTLQSVSFDQDGTDRLVLYPWLTAAEPGQ